VLWFSTSTLERSSKVEATDSKVKDHRLARGGLSFAVMPLIRLEMLNEFKRRIMSLTLIKGSSFVPEVWSALSPELRLFIVSGETGFPDAKAGDEFSVEVLEEAGIWYPGSVPT
ncbi:hypothetical protein FOZ62_012629, partial [Perkinsus olseni]